MLGAGEGLADAELLGAELFNSVGDVLAASIGESVGGGGGFTGPLVGLVLVTD